MLTIQMQGHLRSMGASHLQLGIIGSTYSFVQFFSGPVVGRWSDRVGRKRALLACIVASAAGYALLGQTSSLWLYACLRLYLGIFKHTLNTAKSYLADVASGMSHTELFGKYNAYCQLAFILGGPVSGHLMELSDGFAWISALTAVLFLVNAGLSQILLRSESTAHSLTTTAYAPSSGDRVVGHGVGKQGEADDDERHAATSTGDGYACRGQAWSVGDRPADGMLQFLDSFKSVDWQCLWDVFLVRFLLGLSALVYRDCIVLILKDTCGLSPRHVGYVTSYAAFVGMTSGFAVKWLAWLLGGGSDGHDGVAALGRAAVVQCVALLGLLIACQFGGDVGLVLPLLLAMLLLLSAAGAVSKAASASLTLERGGGAHNAGLLIGVAASVLSISRLVSPLANGMLMHFIGPVAPLLACLLLTGSAALLLLLGSRKQGAKVKES